MSRLKSSRQAAPSYSILILKVSKPQALQKKEALMVEKKIKGRKRHIVVDTDGNLLHVKVHEANIHDTVGGCKVFEEALAKYPRS